MTKKIFTYSMILAVLVVSALAASPALAQEDVPDGNNLAHDYLVAYVSSLTGLSADEIEARLDAGETLAAIAGVDDVHTFMADARAYVAAAMAEDGISIPGWTKGMRGGSARGAGMGNGAGGGNAYGDGSGTGDQPMDGTGNQYANPDNGYGDGTGTGDQPADGTGNQYGNPGNGSGDGTCDPETCDPQGVPQGGGGQGMGNPNNR